MISAGVIGYKNHSKKIINILEKNIDIKYIYHPFKKINLKNFTNNITDLLGVDCVFILSPNYSHFEYLNYFNKKKYKGYIFCEKPPVVKLKEIKKLKSFNLNNTYFNFNYRHSFIANFLKKKNKKLGDLISATIIDSKPLIYKKSFKNNWRFNTKEILINNNLIHFIDVIGFCLKDKIKNLNMICSKSKTNLKIFDTVSVSFKVKNILFNLSVSYGTVLEKKILLYFSNGKIEIGNNITKTYFPGILTNKNKIFIEPKLLNTTKTKNLPEASLKKSIKYFLNKVKLKQKFTKSEINKSIVSNEICINLSNTINMKKSS